MALNTQKAVDIQSICTKIITINRDWFNTIMWDFGEGNRYDFLCSLPDSIYFSYSENETEMYLDTSVLMDIYQAVRDMSLLKPVRYGIACSKGKAFVPEESWCDLLDDILAAELKQPDKYVIDNSVFLEQIDVLLDRIDYYWYIPWCSVNVLNVLNERLKKVDAQIFNSRWSWYLRDKILSILPAYINPNIDITTRDSRYYLEWDEESMENFLGVDLSDPVCCDTLKDLLNQMYQVLGTKEDGTTDLQKQGTAQSAQFTREVYATSETWEFEATGGGYEFVIREGDLGDCHKVIPCICEKYFDGSLYDEDGNLIKWQTHDNYWTWTNDLFSEGLCGAGPAVYIDYGYNYVAARFNIEQWGHRGQHAEHTIAYYDCGIGPMDGPQGAQSTTYAKLVEDELWSSNQVDIPNGITDNVGIQWTEISSDLSYSMPAPVMPDNLGSHLNAWEVYEGFNVHLNFIRVDDYENSFTMFTP